MLPLSDGTVYAGLLALALVCLPLGAFLLRVAEWFLGRRVRLSPLERILLSFYATGGLLFGVASIPTPLYGTASLVGLLAAGALGYAVLAVREGGRGLATTFRFFQNLPGILVGLGCLGLLAIEVVGGSLVLPNGIDGAVDSLFVNRLLALHTVPWTLQPYASVGVTYPQGSTVWFSLPVLLFGWPIIAAPVVLPPLFLSLTPAAAFCLGARWDVGRATAFPRMGLLFAAFFGLVASWPRLYVGGSYDFILGLPLLLVVLGLLRPFVRGSASVRMAVALGMVLGTATAVSTTVGMTLGLLLLGCWATVAGTTKQRILGGLARVFASLAIAAVFLSRSIVGVLTWWSYPGHVMTSNSIPPYSPLVSQETYTGVVSQIDPFSPWKWKLSPFPVLALELQVLLVGGLLLSVLVLADRPKSLRRYLPVDLVEWTLVNTGLVLLITAVVGVLGQWNTSLSGVQSVTNLWELSILLFLLYSLVAILPLVAALNYLWKRQDATSTTSRVPGDASASFPSAGHRRSNPRRRWKVVMAVAVLVVPLASGLVVTSGSMTGYLHTYLLGQSNGTQEDVTVLQWAGDHLPSCSGVLAAPGSAAQFLPEFTTVHIIYPTFPTPTNLTYYEIVQNLSSGRYGPATRAGMVSLGVTEVFVTGATTNTYPPFSLTPFETSADFTLLFSSGDAYLFAFGPGISAQGCPPG